MTPAELVATMKARRGDDWKGKAADETGWSWHTFHRIEKGGEVSPKCSVSQIAVGLRAAVRGSFCLQPLEKCG